LPYASIDSLVSKCACMHNCFQRLGASPRNAPRQDPPYRAINKASCSAACIIAASITRTVTSKTEQKLRRSSHMACAHTQTQTQTQTQTHTHTHTTMHTHRCRALTESWQRQMSDEFSGERDGSSCSPRKHSSTIATPHPFAHPSTTGLSKVSVRRTEGAGLRRFASSL
jgi:hypothetical protein